MKIIKKAIAKLPLKTKLYLREISNFRKPFSIVKTKNILDRKVKETNGLNIKDGLEVWHRSFKKFILSNLNESEVAYDFFENNIELVSQSKFNYDNREVILLCVVKNDLMKLKKMVDHHRGIGVTHFAILDNISTDGTAEWVKDQPDIDLFTNDDKYTTNRREAWINRLIAYYGLNRWYLIVDSDELFVYQQMEEYPIECLIKYCVNHSITRIRGLMVDMYAEDAFYLQNNDEDYLTQCIYFDLNSYKKEERDYIELITGGPRERMFNQNPWLTKYPLCYFSKGDIQSRSHFLFPFNKNKNSECLAALLHYKFLPSDLPKYKMISENSNYYNGSIEYKKYLEVMEHNILSFMYE
ncbi:glycosyltransferase family 2 protein, partial [Paenibacillus typhae]